MIESSANFNIILTRTFLLMLLFLSSFNVSYGQSIGLNFINHLSFDRDVKYAPGLGLYVMEEFSDKFDVAVSIGYCKRIYLDPKEDYKIDYNRRNIKVDFNYTYKKFTNNSLKIGFSAGYELEKFVQSGIVSNWVTGFANKCVGLGIPLSFQSQKIINLPLVLNFNISPTYLRVLQKSGRESSAFTGNTKDNMYIDLIIGIAYKVK